MTIIPISRVASAKHNLIYLLIVIGGVATALVAKYVILNTLNKKSYVTFYVKRIV